MTHMEAQSKAYIKILIVPLSFYLFYCRISKYAKIKMLYAEQYILGII